MTKSEVEEIFDQLKREGVYPSCDAVRRRTGYGSDRDVGHYLRLIRAERGLQAEPEILPQGKVGEERYPVPPVDTATALEVQRDVTGEGTYRAAEAHFASIIRSATALRTLYPSLIAWLGARKAQAIGWNQLTELQRVVNMTEMLGISRLQDSVQSAVDAARAAHEGLALMEELYRDIHRGDGNGSGPRPAA